MPQRFQHLATLRLILAVLVIISHAYPLTANPEPIAAMTHIVSAGALAVIMFFFISGFLVTMSWQKLQNPIAFTIHRVFRIWPALVIALLFSAGVGVWVSSSPSSQAIESAWHYFWGNLPLIQGIHFQISGAFSEQPNTSINGSLWTLEWEVFCYIALLALGMTGLLKHNPIAKLLAITIMAVIFITAQTQLSIFRNSADVAMMLFSFALGALSYSLFLEIGGRILWKLYFVLAVIFAMSGSIFLPLAYIFAAAGLVALISFDNLLRPGDLKLDLSYGVYIFAFPVQQLVVHLNPDVTPWQNFFITLPIVLIMAYLSWTLVEKRFIGYGKTLGNLVKKSPQQADTSHSK